MFHRRNRSKAKAEKELYIEGKHLGTVCSLKNELLKKDPNVTRKLARIDYIELSRSTWQPLLFIRNTSAFEQFLKSVGGKKKCITSMFFPKEFNCGKYNEKQITKRIKNLAVGNVFFCYSESMLEFILFLLTTFQVDSGYFEIYCYLKDDELGLAVSITSRVHKVLENYKLFFVYWRLNKALQKKNPSLISPWSISRYIGEKINHCFSAHEVRFESQFGRCKITFEIEDLSHLSLFEEIRDNSGLFGKVKISIRLKRLQDIHLLNKVQCRTLDDSAILTTLTNLHLHCTKDNYETLCHLLYFFFRMNSTSNFRLKLSIKALTSTEEKLHEVFLIAWVYYKLLSLWKQKECRIYNLRLVLDKLSTSWQSVFFKTDFVILFAKLVYDRLDFVIGNHFMTNQILPSRLTEIEAYKRSVRAEMKYSSIL